MSNPITIRPYKSSDFPVLMQLFREAVAAINIRHYSQEQIAVWTTIDPARWQTKFETMIVYVAEIGSQIVGFADITYEGYLDHLYVHKNYQARWVSLHLFRAIEKIARNLGLSKITTDCSITAKLPAERMSFKVIKEQVVEKHGMKFINYHMEKKLA
ncbi:GNAT family N-acetyltransferase [soil metagenome]